MPSHPHSDVGTGASSTAKSHPRSSAVSSPDTSRSRPTSVATHEPSPLRRWRDRIILVAVVWAVWALITTLVVQPFKIPSPSMENTLGVGDRVVVAKWVGGEDVKRGDVVVFSDPDHWLGDQPPSGSVMSTLRSVAEFTHLSASGAHLVKRVVGLPGDHVSCASATGKLTVNGVAVDEPYLKPGVRPCDDGAGFRPFSVTVPAGRLWVMGDNRSDSADSRAHDDGTGRTGSVPRSDVTGRSLAIVWPLTDLGGGHNDEDAFAEVPAAT